MKKKLGKILCGAVSTAAIVGGAAYVIKKILGQNDIIDSDESEDDYEDEFDDDFEQVFSDNNKDEREYVTINITDDSDKADVKKDEVSDDKTEEVSDDKTEEKNTEDELKEETSKEETTQEDSVKATQENN